MSHITECQIDYEITDAKVLRDAVNLMRKEGWIVEQTDRGYAIDMTSKGYKHYYGGAYNRITVEKANNKYTIKGDPWSVEEGYNTTLNTLKRSYMSAAVVQALKKTGFMNPNAKTAETSSARSIGKTMIKAMRV